MAKPSDESTQKDSAVPAAEQEKPQNAPQPAEESKPPKWKPEPKPKVVTPESSPEQTEAPKPKGPACPKCGSSAIGIGGGLRHCNQCGHSWS